MLRAVICDCGGVVFEDMWEAFRKDRKHGILSIISGYTYEELGPVFRFLWKKYAIRHATEEDYWNDFTKLLGLENVDVTAFTDMTEKFVKEIPGTIDILKRLKGQGVSMAVCSNAIKPFFEKQARELKLYDIFKDDEFTGRDKIILSWKERAEKSSPNYEMYNAAVKVLNVEPSECVFVDDRPSNVERAIELGMTGILFPSHAEFGAKYLERLLREMRILE